SRSSSASASDSSGEQADRPSPRAAILSRNGSLRVCARRAENVPKVLDMEPLSSWRRRPLIGADGLLASIYGGPAKHKRAGPVDLLDRGGLRRETSDKCPLELGW